MVSFISHDKQNHLVVGINGTIGSALFHHLQQHTLSVWGTTQRPPQAAPTNVFYLNLLDPAFSQLPSIAFDVVYLCAGVCRMAACEDDPRATEAINVIGMQRLIETLAARGAFIVFLSTNQVFSGEKAHTLANSSQAPMNEYGRQKAKLEAYLQAHHPHSAIVRLTKVVEPNMDLFKTWIAHLLAKQPIAAFTDMMLAPVTLAQVIRVLVEIGKHKKSGCYQLSGAEDVSYHTVALHLAELLQLTPAYVKAISAEEKGVKKNFLPQFTSLDCSSTIALCGEMPLSFVEVIDKTVKIK